MNFRKKGAGSASSRAPDRGLKAFVHPPLDPQDGKSLHQHKDRVAESDSEKRDERTHPRRRVAARDELREDLAQQDRNGESGEAAENAHRGDGPEVAPPTEERETKRRTPVGKIVRKRRIEDNRLS